MATIVIAPDSFKGTATATEVVDALSVGWRRCRPQDQLVPLPVADGGEGTLDCVARAVPGSRRVPVTVPGPLGDPVDTDWLLLPDGSGLVELASTCGLHLAPLDALGSSTTGFGQAIAAALDHGVDRLLLAIGGSASTDGGAGMLAALGARLEGVDDALPILGGADLLAVVGVDLGALRALPTRGVLVLSDVTNPLTGPTGAAAVFGPQKGARPEDVRLLDRALSTWASLLPGVDRDTPGAGAAGGTGFGLLAWGATIRSGAGEVLALTGLADRLAAADLVVTGEGTFDEQTAAGKLVSHVLQHAADAAVETALVAGRVALAPAGVAQHLDLSAMAGSSREAMARPAYWLQRAGTALAEGFTRRRDPRPDHDPGGTR